MRPAEEMCRRRPRVRSARPATIPGERVRRARWVYLQPAWLSPRFPEPLVPLHLGCNTPASATATVRLNDVSCLGHCTADARPICARKLKTPAKRRCREPRLAAELVPQCGADAAILSRTFRSRCHAVRVPQLWPSAQSHVQRLSGSLPPQSRCPSTSRYQQSPGECPLQQAPCCESPPRRSSSTPASPTWRRHRMRSRDSQSSKRCWQRTRCARVDVASLRR